ncbi:FHA domain-containing protein [Curtobacterium sp. VKM Ac-1395]|uniref:FHA domain-containing protein n=1 Tax=Curtobacterium sp. VKM Ac-1395 TaxID=2783815 RepID=UPI00188AF8FE|nr:FHA domain-containing protein [Curtobacterium sp. VKM Ac-1395]MBF4592084.1 FHA domain-containing protein [Curtobacterium sp. VKM Ac-1395]
MSDNAIPHFPVVVGNVYPDGTAHINFAGHDVPLHPENIDDARAQITSYAVAVARDVLHRPVRLTTSDPDGQWTLAAHPDGRITDLAPAVRPAKRPRRRPDAASAPRSRPGTPQPTTPVEPSTAVSRAVRPESAGMPVVSATAPSSAPVAPAPQAVTRVADVPTWVPSDLPSEAEMTVFVARHQPAAAPALTLDFPSVTIRVTGDAIVGRRPVNTTGAPIELHEVVDETRNLSRTHFAITWHEDVPAIIDQHTGNGTIVRRGEHDFEAAPGVAMVLADGDLLKFGEVRCRVRLSTADVPEGRPPR